MISPLTLKRSRPRPTPPRLRRVAIVAPEAPRAPEPVRPLPSWRVGPDGLECEWHLG